MLAEHGYVPKPSKTVDDFELRGRLWELIYALAAKRIFFFATDHFSDREFYDWLEVNWLPGEAADLPPDSEWNCHVDVSESGTATMTGEQLYLRYYADDDVRRMILEDDPSAKIPDKVPTPFNRDAFMPRPHEPVKNDAPLIDLESSEENDDADDDELEDDDDPLGLASVDREIQKISQQNQAKDASPMPEAPPILGDEALQDWIEQVIEKSKRDGGHTMVRPIDLFREADYTPMPAAELTEETVAPALWELLHEMSRLNLFVTHTDHLSNDELYTELTRTVIHHKILIPEIMAMASCYHDFLDHGKQAPNQLWLTYYADDEARKDWSRNHPGQSIPAKKRPPFHRDWQLPHPPMR